MAWRNQGITGSNNIPLGKRRFGGDADKDKEDDATNGNITTSNGIENGDLKRGRSPERMFVVASCISRPVANDACRFRRTASSKEA
jgi:hypothetical protein